MFKCKPLPPFLVFNVDPPAGSSNPPAELSDEQFLEQNGFPRNTKTEDMTPEQEAKYWRNQSKTQQKAAEDARRESAKWAGLGDFDAVSQTISDADQKRREALTDQQKAAEDAQKTGESAGFTKAQALYLRPAVHAILVAQTKGADEKPEDADTRVKAVLDVLDVTKFVTDTGELDAAKVGSFAQSLAPKDSNGGAPSGDPIADALRRGEQTPQGHGGSVAAMEQVIYDRLKPSK